MIKYGLISEIDARCLEKTIDLICTEFKSPDDWLINVLELGVYGGATGNGIRKYLHFAGREIMLTGIDNKKDNEEVLYPYDNLIIGNSDEVAYKIPDESQHLIFVDGCHCFAHVVSDFFCYAPKVKVGGYLCFHDTGKHIKPFKDFQHGHKENTDAYISVRKALKAIGLIEYGVGFTFGKQYDEKYPGWELVFDEADPNDEAGGICVFCKLY